MSQDAETPDGVALTLAYVQHADDPLGYGGRITLTAHVANNLPRRADGSRRYVCSIGDTVSWHCGLMPDGTGDFMILVNKERRDKLRAAGYDLAALPATLTPDTSDYGMPMPEELGELLAQDSDADRYFHALTPGKQRALIHQVAKPKREDTRLRKAVGIVEYLVEVRGELDFREMNAWLRER